MQSTEFSYNPLLAQSLTVGRDMISTSMPFSLVLLSQKNNTCQYQAPAMVGLAQSRHTRLRADIYWTRTVRRDDDQHQLALVLGARRHLGSRHDCRTRGDAYQQALQRG